MRRFEHDGRFFQRDDGYARSDNATDNCGAGRPFDLTPDSARRAEGEAKTPGKPQQITPILGGSRQFYKLLSGLIEKHGSRPFAVDSVFDLIQLVQQFQPSVIFVSLELLANWNASGIQRLSLSEGFKKTRIVAFTERWQREELPAMPGLDLQDTLCVPLSITYLESIMLRHLH